MKNNLSTIISRLSKKYSYAKTSLNFKTPYQLLVATILSAQCTDARVNKVTPALFEKYKTVQDMAKAKLSDIERLVNSTGFYRNKSKNIKASAQMIVDEFNGEIPKSMDGMIKLPGVARKTANVVLGNAFGIISGIAVDTHVGRLSRRLGFTINNDPKKVESDLMAIVPKKSWINLTHWFIYHGRAMCESRKPKCDTCFLKDVCPSAGMFDSKGKWIGPK